MTGGRITLLATSRAQQVAEKARAVLKTSPYPYIVSVRCEVIGKTLVLTGRVPSYYMKQLAQTAIRPILDEDLRIENRVEVD